MANPFNRGNVSRKDAKAMGDMLAGGKSTRSSIYSRTMRQPPPEQKLLSVRALVTMVLLVAIPPVGIALLWRMRLFLPRGRTLLTVLSTLILTVMVSAWMPSGSLQTVVPSPVAPSSFTSVDSTQAEADLDRIQQITDQPSTSSSSVLVYTADGDPYYHAGEQCGDTELTLMLTLEEALERSLSPCPECQPSS